VTSERRSRTTISLGIPASGTVVRGTLSQGSRRKSSACAGSSYIAKVNTSNDITIPHAWRSIDCSVSSVVAASTSDAAPATARIRSAICRARTSATRSRTSLSRIVRSCSRRTVMSRTAVCTAVAPR
jgi:hypothetical protein